MLRLVHMLDGVQRTLHVQPLAAKLSGNHVARRADGSQGIAKFVGHTGSQLADRCQPFLTCPDGSFGLDTRNHDGVCDQKIGTLVKN